MEERLEVDAFACKDRDEVLMEAIFAAEVEAISLLDLLTLEGIKEGELV